MDLESGEFKLPPPKELSGEAREALVEDTLHRIWDGSNGLTDLSTDKAEFAGASSSDMWMLLLVRLVTRVADPSAVAQTEGSPKDEAAIVSDIYAYQDKLRQTLCDYIMDDFSSRYVILLLYLTSRSRVTIGSDLLRHG